MESRADQIVVTGMGCVSAAGSSVTETARTFFEDAAHEKFVDSGASDYLKLNWQADWFKKYDFSPDGDLSTLFALMAIDEALNDAGLDISNSRLRVGICLGSTVGGTNYNPAFNESYFRGLKPEAEPLFGYATSNSAQWIARRLVVSGPRLLINNACTSGTDAIGVGLGWLRSGACDVAICGGSEVILPKIFYGFRSLQLTSNKLCAPFDRDRQGLTLGEGAGIVILERASTLRRVRARVLGYGAACDAFHPTAPHPEARGLENAARAALRRSKVEFSQIDFVNAHATATPSNDLSEGRWISRRLPHARTVATKGYTGHTLGAAGALEAVFTILSLQTQKLPPSRGFQQTDPEIGLTPTTAVETGRFEKALSLSLGFGGINSVLALERAP